MKVSWAYVSDFLADALDCLIQTVSSPKHIL